jgi:uncharacterized protein YndB with AHSA1/START domain
MNTAAADPTTVTLPSDTEIAMTRVFDAPRELVWEAVTRPEHFARWWGPRRYTSEIHEMDVRPGGRWRVDQHGEGGIVHPFHGEYLEVDPPSRLVLTQGYRDFPPLLVTITLEEADGGTRLTSLTRADSPEGRDALLASGMEGGARESLDRLAELLATL